MRDHFYESHKHQQDKEVLEGLRFNITGVDAEMLLRLYKKIATVTHPDKGGSNDDMIALNNLKDRLKYQMEIKMMGI